jgi:23S rRNA (adenine1618-N6)-methyltransferase
MHPQNPHKDRYDLKALAKVTPELSQYIKTNEYNDETIDFSDSEAVKALNKALLKLFYDIKYWDIPKGSLCPPIPGRADYIHTVADLFLKKSKLKVLDIGTGANLIYPLIGLKEYDWSFVATDVDAKSLQNAKRIIEQNQLEDGIELRLQKNRQHIFKTIIQDAETFDLTICNPPFHESLEAATEGTLRKWKNLGKKSKETVLNFGGQGSELWCPGGERQFILNMIQESQSYKTKVRFFTTLVSKEANLPALKASLKASAAQRIEILEMAQGQKRSRILCWSFLT